MQSCYAMGKAQAVGAAGDNTKRPHRMCAPCSRPPTPGELQAYKELSPARFIAVWKTHLSNLSAMLLQLDMRPDDRRVVDGLVDGVVRMGKGAG